jgi:hypothetical protein
LLGRQVRERRPAIVVPEIDGAYLRQSDQAVNVCGLVDGQRRLVVSMAFVCKQRESPEEVAIGDFGPERHAYVVALAQSQSIRTERCSDIVFARAFFRDSEEAPRYQLSKSWFC